MSITVTGANRRDSMAFEPTLDAIPAVPGLNGQPRKRPDKLHADKGYDFARCRRYLRQRGITAHIARRGVEARERLGRHRWVVERTHARFAGFGKLRIRFERRLDIHTALLSLAAVVISRGISISAYLNGSGSIVTSRERYLCALLTPVACPISFVRRVRI
ncbi:transposase [Paraburkholderia bannensis]|uniref:Transposase n=1 Tax=Paraburkholderia bannensis TaxID=765414 RepID=A0A7W9U5P4_9BURK|nr:transposase [Paraburkholderia sp. WP4_3_2]MBB6106761.1 transposase [Paraburkholderia bannensis]